MRPPEEVEYIDESEPSLEGQDAIWGELFRDIDSVLAMTFENTICIPIELEDKIRKSYTLTRKP